VTRFSAVVAVVAALSGEAEAACREETAGAATYAVCEFDPKTDDLRLFLRDADGATYGEFDAVNAALGQKGERLVFAMNAGMYHKDRTPVGLYVENGEELKKISTKDGPGNFHLKPNGVFWIDKEGVAGVTETEAFRARFQVPKSADAASAAPPSPACGRGQGEGSSKRESRSLDAPSPLAPLPQAGEGKVCYATQSGPMLVIDGAIHPKFLVDATSRKRRNGAGVREDGVVVFAISDSAVTFHEFASYFRDALKTPNALYLDGTISRLHAPEIGRNEPGLPMGPIVGVVTKFEGNGENP
jgi:uncharacterized protein YigE (DUF2233 family)